MRRRGSLGRRCRYVSLRGTLLSLETAHTAAWGSAGPAGPRSSAECESSPEERTDDRRPLAREHRRSDGCHSQCGSLEANKLKSRMFAARPLTRQKPHSYNHVPDVNHGAAHNISREHTSAQISPSSRVLGARPPSTLHGAHVACSQEVAGDPPRQRWHRMHGRHLGGSRAGGERYASRPSTCACARACACQLIHPMYGEPSSLPTASLPTACALQERAAGTCGIAAAAAAASAPPVGTTAPRLHSSWRTGRFRGSVDGAAA